MNRSLLKLSSLNILQETKLVSSQFIRHGHHIRGKPPGVAKSLQQKFEAMRYKDPTLHFKVDIGLPPIINKSVRANDKKKVLKSKHLDPELEKLARTQQLQIDLDQSFADWEKTVGPQQIRTIAEHYGVFEHLFGDAYFVPQIPLKVTYTVDDLLLPVYFGNPLKPAQCQNQPLVHYETDKSNYFSLILTNPDGNLFENDKECLHWFVGNIPGNDLNSGETIAKYLQPFPSKGTGYQRLIFILYKQDKKVDFSKYKITDDLKSRTFKTYDFYRELQDVITPAGLAFYQSDYDLTIKQFFHKALNMKEPIFEYEFPPPYIRPQQWHPKKHPFNLYMDKYRDPKQIHKEFLLRKLKNVHPFKAPPPPAPYPHAITIDDSVPTWLQLEIRKSRMKWGRINDIE